MTPSGTVYLSLGANLGDRRRHIEDALKLLHTSSAMILQDRSAFYETEPQDVHDQPWFLNVVASGTTAFEPIALLSFLQDIERKLGRNRDLDEVRRGPRAIDIDILLFGDVILGTPELTIPHPRMLERRFVLEPLLEIAPHASDPATGRPLQSFLAGLTDQQVVRLPEPRLQGNEPAS